MTAITIIAIITLISLFYGTESAIGKLNEDISMHYNHIREDMMFDAM